MKADRNKLELDELISQAIGRQVPAFDFGKWKDNHRAEIDLCQSQTAEQAASHSVRIFAVWRVWMKSPITQCAAAAVLIVASFVMLHSSETRLYAQVSKTMGNARTIHYIGQEMHNGKWQNTAEIWCKKGVGERRIEWDKNKETVTVNNGQYTWKYTTGNSFAIRDKSSGVEMGLSAELHELEKYLKMCQRESSGDMIIDGFQCDLHVATSHTDLHLATKGDDAEEFRMMFWIDSQKKLRRCEKRTPQNDEWVLDAIGEIEYDVELDPTLLRADFGREVKIIEAEEKLDEYFSLDETVFTRETIGLIFAIHKVKRYQSDMLYIVCSLRPTEETRREFRYQGRSTYGGFNLDISWKQIEPSSGHVRWYQHVNLGRIGHTGLDARWYLLAPKGLGAERIDQCELKVRIEAGRDHKRHRTASGLSREETFKPLATLSLPEEHTSLAQVLDDVYGATQSLESIVEYGELAIKERPYTDEELDELIEKFPNDKQARRQRSGDKSVLRYHPGWTKPSDMSKDDWAKERIGYLDEVRNK